MTGPEPDAGTYSNIHASCVCLDGRGLLIRGRSGAGKSGLALQLMALGATLVADDRVDLTRHNGEIFASSPEPLAGLIEMRGIGILRAEYDQAKLVAVVDLDLRETARLPEPALVDILGVSLCHLKTVESPIFVAGLMQFLKIGRQTK